MKRIFILILFLLLLVFTGCGNKEKETEYGEDVNVAIEEILDNTSFAEGLLNKYADLWSYSIESRGGISVEDAAKLLDLSESTILTYFTVDYNSSTIYSGWQSNITSLQDYFKKSNRLKRLEETSSEIKKQIKELKNPPESYKKVYDELLEMYTLEEEYIQMALNPSGSIVSFNEDRRQLSDDIISKHNKIEVLMPDSK